MSSNKLLSLFFFIGVILIIFNVGQAIKINRLSGELEIRKSDLKKTDKQIKLKIDSIRELKKTINVREVYWVTVQQQRRDSLALAHKEANFWRTKYQHDKNNPVPRYTAPQLDSIISAIIR